MGEIQRADPKALRATIVIVCVGAVAGALLIAAAERYEDSFRDWITRDFNIRSRVVFSALTVLTAGPTLAVAAYFWRLGRRIVSAERYPPVGMRLLRDMPVVTGQMARRRGRLIQTLALIAAVAVLSMVFFLWRVLLLLEAR